MTRMLVAYSQASTHVQTTREYLKALKRFLGYEVHYIHVTHNANIATHFESYDIVFQNYCARLCFEDYVSQSYLKKLREFRGLKVLAVQDEYDRTDTLKTKIKEFGFDIVLTCVPQKYLEYVYPRDEFPSVTFLTVLTGYVPENFGVGKPKPRPLSERPIQIGYRGRDLGARYGRLGFDKAEIGRRMKDVCRARGIACDISISEADRIYGEDWLEFIGSCRTMLGTESGSNVFDFDGSLEKNFAKLTKANGGRSPSYEQFGPLVADRESEIEMGQISPRIFECALMCTPMILFRGNYSNVLVPHQHYIPLEKDFSNLDEVLRRVEDIPALQDMASRAYEHVVQSGLFGYEAYGKTLRSAFDSALERRTSPPAAPSFLATAVDTDLRAAALAEFPEEFPQGVAELEATQTCVAILDGSKSQNEFLSSIEVRAQRFSKAISEHLALLNEIEALSNAGSTLARTSSDQKIVEAAAQKRAVFDREQAELRRGIADIKAVIERGQQSSLQGVRRDLLHKHQRMLRAYMAFFESAEDLRELNSLAFREIGRLEDVPLGKRLTLRISALASLLDAPPRVVLSILLHKVPAVREPLYRLREIIRRDA